MHRLGSIQCRLGGLIERYGEGSGLRVYELLADNMWILFFWDMTINQRVIGTTDTSS